MHHPDDQYVSTKPSYTPRQEWVFRWAIGLIVWRGAHHFGVVRHLVMGRRMRDPNWVSG